MTIPWSKQIQKTKKKGSKVDVPFINSIVNHAKTVYNQCKRGCHNCSCFFGLFVATKAPGPLTTEQRSELHKLRLKREEKEEAARVALAAGLVTSHHSVFSQFMVYLFLCNLEVTLYSELMVLRGENLKEQKRTVISPHDETLSMI